MDWNTANHYQLSLNLFRVEYMAIAAACRAGSIKNTAEIVVFYSVYGLQYNWWHLEDVCKPVGSYANHGVAIAS